jgi:hypothetical protein
MRESTNRFTRIAELDRSINEALADVGGAVQRGDMKRIYVSADRIATVNGLAREHDLLLLQGQTGFILQSTLGVPTVLTFYGVPLAADASLTDGQFRIE